MNALESFSTFYVAFGAPTITLTKNGLGISKSVVQKLNCAPFVKVLFDKAGRRMAIQICDESEQARIEFCRNGKAEGARWNARDLMSTIRSIAGWDVENTNGYKVEGEYIDATDTDKAAIIFDLNKGIRV